MFSNFAKPFAIVAFALLMFAGALRCHQTLPVVTPAQATLASLEEPGDPIPIPPPVPPRPKA